MFNPIRNLRDRVSDDDEDDYFFFRRRSRRNITRHDFFDIYDEKDFKIRFRLDKSSALDVCDEIEEMLEPSSERNNPLSPMNQLLLALRFYATGCMSLTLGDYIGVSTSTASRTIHRVSKAICSLKNKYIRFPSTNAELRESQELNYEVASFPRVIAMLDCTHIKISSPGGQEPEQFRNRKGYFSINSQLMCNADLEILDLVARWPGSAHDSSIFNSCYRKAMFEDGRYGNGLLLGDSGYSLTEYLMTPLENPVLRGEFLYNEAQIRTRNCIERLFGVWKRRFPVLALGFRLKLENIFPVITATAVLHNILRGLQDDDPPDDESLGPLPWDDLLNHGQILQNAAAAGPRQRPGQRVRNILIRDYFERL